MNADNVTFETAPGFYEDYIGPESYVTLYVDQWLDLVNRKISPLSADITATGVSILTRGADGRLYVTDGNRVGDPSWGASSRAPSASNGAGTSSTGSGASGTPAPGPGSGVGGDPEDGVDDTEDNGYDPEGFDPDDPERQGGADDHLDDYPGEPGDDPDPGEPGEGTQEHADPRIDVPPETIDPLDSDPYERNDND